MKPSQIPYGLHHVQVPIPAGGEPAGRGFYAGLLGLKEISKPAALAARGGLWFELADSRQLHLGVESDFRPNRKAHPAFDVADLDGLAGTLSECGSPVVWDQELEPKRRFYGEDPFGNRLEFLEASDG